MRVRSPAKMSEALALAAKADFASDARRARGASKRRPPCQSNKKVPVLRLSVFGISKFDRIQCQEKLEKQKAYMRSFSFVNDFGEVRSLLDFSMAANFSRKYYAEVANRVNTLGSFAIDYAQRPVFLTITLNGCFRGALSGDYSKFKDKDMKFLPTEVKYKAKNGAPLTISDLCATLNHQWRIFFRRFTAKFKVDYSYIRCFEPHKKDGVPHIHALLFVPGHTIDFLRRTYKDIFYAPQNLRVDAISREQIANGETNGFQTSIHNPAGYVMKYIQKTFINLEKTQELDDLAAWYVKHKVRRFLTSQNNVPLWVYRKINFIATMRDFYHLNNFKNDDNNVLEWDKQSDYIYINIPERKEVIIYDNGKLEHYVCDRLINSYDRKKPPKNVTSQSIKPDLDAWVDAWYVREGEKIKREAMKNRKEFKKPPLWMKNYELYNYYSKLDKANCNIQHLAYVENIMLDRGLNSFTKRNTKHDLNNPDLEDFIERGLREYQF